MDQKTETETETAIRTQREVAEIMTARGAPMSRQRVSQIEARALKKLRQAAEAVGLKQDWRDLSYGD